MIYATYFTKVCPQKIYIMRINKTHQNKLQEPSIYTRHLNFKLSQQPLKI